MMFVWGDEIVVRADRFYSVGLYRATTWPIEIPGMKSITALANKGKSERLALGRDEGGYLLKKRGTSGWRSVPLPEVVRSSSKHYLLGADEESIVLFGEDHCYLLSNDGAPREIRLKPQPETKFKLMVGGEPHRCFLRDDHIYLAYDRGEWGGALTSVDLKTGHWTVISDDLPVRELKVDTRGRLWAVEGINHLGHQAGILRVCERQEWSVFASVGSYDYEVKKQRNWNLPVYPIHSVSFDSRGTPYVIAECEGVARWDKGKWELVTRGWPKQSFQGANYVISSDALQIAWDSLALVSMGDAGIAIWDLKSDRVARVTLR